MFYFFYTYQQLVSDVPRDNNTIYHIEPDSLLLIEYFIFQYNFHMSIQKRFKYLPGTTTYSLQQTCIKNSLDNRNPRELMALCDGGMTGIIFQEIQALLEQTVQ